MLKKMFSTLLIIIGIAFAGVVACMAVMVIFPNVHIFGYKFLRDVGQVESQKNATVGVISSFNVESTSFPVKIEKLNESSSSDYQIIMNKKTYGFVKAEGFNVADFNVSYSNNNTFTIKTIEPQGFTISPQKELIVKVKQSKIANLDSMTLNVKQSDLQIDKALASTVNNLTVIKGVQSSSLDLGSLTAKDSLNVTTDAGRIDLTNMNLSDANVQIETRIGSFIMNDVKNLTVKSEVSPYVEVNNVAQKLDYNAKSGSVKVKGSVNGTTKVYADSAEIDINKINGMVDFANYAGEDLKNNCAFTIGNISTTGVDAVRINLNDGSLKIKQVDSNVIIKTNKANVLVGDKEGNLGVNCNTFVAATKYGKMDLYFNPEKQVKTEICAKAGFINVYGLNPAGESTIGTVVTESGLHINDVNYRNESTAINVEIVKLTVNDFKIEGKSKDVTVKFGYVGTVNFDVSTNGGKIDIDVTQLGLSGNNHIELTKYNFKDYKYPANVVAKTNDVTKFGCERTIADATGKITVSSTNNIYFKSI